MLFNSFLASGDFCRLLKTFANSLDPDLFDTLIVFMKEFFGKVNFEKSQQTTKKMKNTQHAKSLVPKFHELALLYSKVQCRM